MQTVTVSSQRQITIPASFLDQIGVEKKQKLLLFVRQGDLIAQPLGGSVVKNTSGSLNSLIPDAKKGVDLATIRRETAGIVASKLAKE